MNDLFKKINTLVSATINEVLGETSSRAKSLTPANLGKDIDREVAALRQKINDALEHETYLQKQLASLDSEIARWDSQADEAVAQGSDSTAKYAISQMQAAERRRAFTESDLNEHRVVTQELIQKVNMLEAAVADARQQQASQTPPPEEEQGRSPSRAMSDVLRDTREKIAQMGDLISAKEEQSGTKTEQSGAPVENPAANPQQVDDDLDRRRQRLSK
jgi:phage shock protein A